MIDIKYESDGIKVQIGEISKFNKNLPFKLIIRKHVSGEEQWSTNLSDGWFATFPNTEMFDVEIRDSKNQILYVKNWDVLEHGNYFYKSLWFYNKSLLSNGVFPKGLVIGTHDGEFGEWVPVVMNRECSVVLVEASDKQFNKLLNNYKNYSLIKPIQNLITPDGKEVIFYEGGEGYTNSVVEEVIKSWETEEIRKTSKESTNINDLIINQCNGKIDWLHLDVEGLDAKLIMAIEKNLLPNFIIFEDFNLGDEQKNSLTQYLSNMNYEMKSEGGICVAFK